MSHVAKFNFPMQLYIRCWNIVGALHSLNRLHSHWKKPNIPRVKAVYFLESSTIGICQNLDNKSTVVKIL